MEEKSIFKPRDFIYMNTSKLDSYFSQLFGGLIQNIQSVNQNEKGNEKRTSISTEVAGEFGLGKGSAKLLDFILSQIGSLDISGKGGLTFDWLNSTKESNTSNTNKTLEHFQYTLFEESMNALGYLIDLDTFFSTNSTIDAGVVRENLNSSDFVKFTASHITISDYRNASEFVKLIKKIIDLSIEFNMGKLIDSADGNDKADLKREATAKIASLFMNQTETKGGISERFNVVVEAIYEFFNGEMIPHDILLTSIIQLSKNGVLTFESQLKDEFLLEDRTELSYKYGFFEDTEWTIIGQITSVENPKSPNFKDVIGATEKRIKEIFTQHTSININSTVKEIVQEIDELSKKIGLLPLVGERNIAIAPIAIYREPRKNKFFS